MLVEFIIIGDKFFSLMLVFIVNWKQFINQCCVDIEVQFVLKKFNKWVLLFINVQLFNEGEIFRVEFMVVMEIIVIYLVLLRLMIMGFFWFLCIVVLDLEFFFLKLQESCMDLLN